jgi:hypothetical protein
MIQSIDFKSADRMNNQKWIKKGFETSLLEPVCGAIQRGDMFYKDLLFEHARGQCVKAMHVGKRHCSEDKDEISSFPKPKPRSSNSQVPRRSRGYDSNLVHDLRQLLSVMSNKKDGAQSSHPSTTLVQEWNEHSTCEPAGSSSCTYCQERESHRRVRSIRHRAVSPQQQIEKEQPTRV